MFHENLDRLQDQYHFHHHRSPLEKLAGEISSHVGKVQCLEAHQ